MEEKVTLREMGYSRLAHERDFRVKIQMQLTSDRQFCDELNRAENALNEGFLGFTLNNGERVSIGFNTMFKPASHPHKGYPLHTWISMWGYEVVMGEIAGGRLAFMPRNQ